MTEPNEPDLYPSRIEDRPRILERRDPVVHTRWSAAAPLSQEQTEAYERDGFLVLRDVFDQAEIEMLRRESARLRGDPAALLPESTITEPGSGAVRSVFKVHDQSPTFGRLAADARLAEVARFLLGDEVYLHQTRVNYKPGFRGKEFYWHSDFETWHVEDGMPRMRALSMSILLTENRSFNGPLMLIPGSHKRYLTCVGATPENHYKESLKKQDIGVPDEASLTELAAAGGIVAPTGPAGTVVLFDCNTMHGSNGNITPFARSNAFIVYNAVSNALGAPFGPKTPRPEVIATRESLAPIEPAPGGLVLEAA